MCCAIFFRLSDRDQDGLLNKRRTFWPGCWRYTGRLSVLQWVELIQECVIALKSIAWYSTSDLFVNTFHKTIHEYAIFPAHSQWILCQDKEYLMQSRRFCWKQCYHRKQSIPYQKQNLSCRQQMIACRRQSMLMENTAILFENGSLAESKKSYLRQLICWRKQSMFCRYNILRNQGLPHKFRGFMSKSKDVLPNHAIIMSNKHSSCILHHEHSSPLRPSSILIQYPSTCTRCEV